MIATLTTVHESPPQTRGPGTKVICDGLVDVMQGNCKLNYLLTQAMQHFNKNLEKFAGIENDDAQAMINNLKQEIWVNLAFTVCMFLPFNAMLANGLEMGEMGPMGLQAGSLLQNLGEGFTGIYGGYLGINQGALEKRLTEDQTTVQVDERATQALTKGAVGQNVKTLENLARTSNILAMLLARCVRVLKAH